MLNSNDFAPISGNSMSYIITGTDSPGHCEDSFLLLREGRMTRGHGIYLIIGLVASFFGGAFLLIAYLMAFEDYAAVIVGVSGGIGSVGWYIAFCCGRMGTSNFDKLE